MIVVECTGCNTRLELPDHTAGIQMVCGVCKSLITVPESGSLADNVGSPGRSVLLPGESAPTDGLSGIELVMWGILFFFIPCVNVVVSSGLYYYWRAKYPRRASQINLLGFGIVGLHILLYFFKPFSD